MNRQSKGHPASQVLANCGKCGLCLSACPVYRVLKEEQASPRARLQLIKAFENQTLKSSPLLKEIISKCLMCGSCAVTCPSGINHYAKFMEMRQKMVDDLGEAPAIRALIHLLSKEFMLRAGSTAAALGQRITPKFLAEKYKIGSIPLSRLPRLNRRPFRETLPSLVRPAPEAMPAGGPRGRIAYFTGCATNYMFADTGEDVVGLLTGLGYEVAIPGGQTCCAIPMLFHGAGKKAKKSIEANIQALTAEAADIIIVDCTTCGAALRDEYPAFLEKALASQGQAPDQARETEDLLARATTIASKTVDIMSFLIDPKFGVAPAATANAVPDGHMGDDTAEDASSRSESRPRAVYHAPCHSRNSFGTHARIQGLLAALPQIDYIPLANEGDCCGGGGTFFYEHPDLARKMMSPKRSAARQAKADLWLTDCPVCRINLAGSLNPEDRIKVCHPVSLVRIANSGQPDSARPDEGQADSTRSDAKREAP